MVSLWALALALALASAYGSVKAFHVAVAMERLSFSDAAKRSVTAWAQSFFSSDQVMALPTALLRTASSSFLVKASLMALLMISLLGSVLVSAFSFLSRPRSSFFAALALASGS